MNPIRMILEAIAEKKRRKKWELYWQEEERKQKEREERRRSHHEPFLRVVDWPDDLIEEYYATITGWGIVFPEDKEEQ